MLHNGEKNVTFSRYSELSVLAAQLTPLTPKPSHSWVVLSLEVKRRLFIAGLAHAHARILAHSARRLQLRTS